MPKRIEMQGLKALIEIQQWTQTRCAEHFGCSLSAVERRCKALSLQTQRTGPRSGSGHTNWKGGRILVGGYVYLYMPTHPKATKRGYYLEHRHTMEQSLGRVLNAREVVHHANGDRQDNRIENLVLFQTNAAHLKHELKGKIPKWSPEGRRRMDAGIRKSAIQRKSGSGGGRRSRPRNHH